MPVHERVRTVGELIEALRRFHPETRVWIKESEPETSYHAADVSTESMGSFLASRKQVVVLK